MGLHEFLIGALSIVSLGDSYAVRQTEPLETQLGIPTTQIAYGGSFAVAWRNNFEYWSLRVAKLQGPVVVVMSMGANDEFSLFKVDPEKVALDCKLVIDGLLLLRPDLKIMQTGYNGLLGIARFSQFLPPETDRYTYIETNHLDRKLRFTNFLHPDRKGFKKRVRFIIRRPKLRDVNGRPIGKRRRKARK